VDVGEALALETGSNVSAQQRSPVTFDPRVRGYHLGQINASTSGEQWIPVRYDLDAILSKIDPKLVDGIDVIPGPYASHLGPGLSFIDVSLMETPRFDNAEWHNRLSLTPRFNGGQFYGSDTVWGGNQNYGFILNYGNRTGSDYTAGNGTRVPTSYHDQNVTAQFGWNLNEDSRVELRYSRLDRTDVEYALQFFDVNFMGTDSVSAAFISTEFFGGAETRVDTWYNRTRFFGDTSGAGKRSTYGGNPDYFVLERIEVAIADRTRIGFPTISRASINGSTRGDLTSTGARFMVTDGDPDNDLIRTGADVRYQQQFTSENFSYSGFDISGTTLFSRSLSTNQPTSGMLDAGLFGEWRKRLLPGFQSRVGGRVDWVHTDVRTVGAFPGDPEAWTASRSSYAMFEDSLSQNDVLFSSYWTGELDLTDGLTFVTSVGYGERAPTLAERYADGVFLTVLQSGFTRVIGVPNARKERAVQADWTLKADYDSFRGRATYFNSWITDCITYDVNPVSDPTGAYLLRTFNTPLATLSGFELQGEIDIVGDLSLIGGLQYVAGTDQDLGRPLPQIAPLDSRLVLHWADRSEENRWSLDFGARMVAQQNRIGFLRLQSTDTPREIEEATPGFMTLFVRGHYRFNNNLSIVGGIDNLTNRNYFEHLNRRLPADPGRYQALQVFAPGFSPYLGMEWTF
jgi:iron complex outermembrane receptor protein